MNLIPNNEKKQMVKSFYFRLAILFLTVIGVSLFILSVGTLPAYLLSFTKDSLINTKLEIQKAEPVPVPDQETLAVIDDLDKKLAIIETEKDGKFIFSKKIIDAILLKKIPEIKIIQISYNNDSPEGKTVNISGTAPSREILLSFRESLEDDTVFKKVDMPISNFIKGRDIQFNLSLMPS